MQIIVACTSQDDTMFYVTQSPILDLIDIWMIALICGTSDNSTGKLVSLEATLLLLLTTSINSNPYWLCEQVA